MLQVEVPVEHLFVKRWDKTFEEMGVEPPDPIELTRRYAEPHRKYHNTRHAINVWYGVMKEAPPVKLAALLHDVVYDVSSVASMQDNEHQSVLVALDTLNGHAPGPLVTEVVRHITNATKYSRCRNWGDMQLHDADYSILSARPDIYTAYAFGVREEYAIFSDTMWQQGRIEFLEKLLDSKSIFFPWNAHYYERDARDNITEELAALKGQS